jgi:hypothetical protein
VFVEVDEFVSDDASAVVEFVRVVVARVAVVATREVSVSVRMVFFMTCSAP